MEENRNEIYLLRKNLQHNHMSIVIIDRDVSEEESQTLYELNKIADIFFMFSDRVLATKDIVKKKFSSLYNALGYVVVHNDFGSGIVKVLKYDLEIFKTTHLGISIITQAFTKSALVNLVEVNNSTITSSVLEINRMSSEDLKQIYTAKTKKKSWWDSYIGVEEDDIDLMFSRYSTENTVIYLSRVSVRSMLEGYNTEEFNKYVESFAIYLHSYQWLIPSMIKSLGIKFINNNINSLNIKSLKNVNN